MSNRQILSTKKLKNKIVKNSNIKAFIVMLLLMFSHCVMAQQTGSSFASTDGTWITEVCVSDNITTTTAQKFTYFDAGEYLKTEIRTLNDMLWPTATVVHDSLCEPPELPPNIVEVVETPFKQAIQTEIFNVGSHLVDDSSVFDNFIAARPNLRNLYFYSFAWQEGMKQNLIGPNLQRLYQINGSTNGQPWPEMPIANSMLYFRVQNDANAVVDIPASWANAKKLQRIYYPKNGLSTAEVDSLITNLEARVLDGMASGFGGTHYLYLQGTGSNANASPTIATHTANGWTNNGSYLTKNIAGQTWQVRKN